MQKQPHMHPWIGRPASPASNVSRPLRSSRQCPGLSQCQSIACNPSHRNFKAGDKTTAIVSVHKMPLQLITIEMEVLHQTVVALIQFSVLQKGQ